MRIAATSLALSFVWLIGCSRDDAKTATTGSGTAEVSPKDLPGEPVGDKTPISNPSGLQIVDLAEGTGPGAPLDRPIQIHYTGYLLDSGQKFDDSRAKSTPHQIILNYPGLLPAWREGIAGMKPGGRRKLVVPAKLAYGQFGRPPLVPGNATIVYDIELLGIKPAPGPATPSKAPGSQPAGVTTSPAP